MNKNKYHDKKSTYIKIRVTPNFRVRLHTIAKSKGLGMSEYIRMFVDDEFHKEPR
jgi:hypothetical protein